MKHRILFIMHMPPPMHGAAQMGQYIHDSELINKSFDCRYLNPSASENVKDVGKLSFRKIGFFFYFLREINKIINKWHPDLVYITPSADGWGFYRDFLNVLLLKYNKCQIVAHFHNKADESFKNKWLNRRLYHSFFKGINTIFLSKRLLPQFEDYLNLDSTFICPNGIKSNIGTFTSRRIDMTKPFRLMFLSNMMEEKGVFLLLEACRNLNDANVVFRCDFIGKWADISEDKFHKTVENYGLEQHVFAHGPKYGEDKRIFFEKAELLVFPTFYHGETFGLVLLEAMDFSLPVIGTEEGGIPDIIEDGKNGFVVPTKDAKSLAEKIRFCIEHRDLAAQMGREGRNKYLSLYTYDSFERRMCSILNDCLNSVHHAKDSY